MKALSLLLLLTTLTVVGIDAYFHKTEAPRPEVQRPSIGMRCSFCRPPCPNAGPDLCSPDGGGGQ